MPEPDELRSVPSALASIDRRAGVTRTATGTLGWMSRPASRRAATTKTVLLVLASPFIVVGVVGFVLGLAFVLHETILGALSTILIAVLIFVIAAVVGFWAYRRYGTG
jgi:antibiotic biosynthesis monooxygenase (ABM) superfamily enzyme